MALADPPYADTARRNAGASCLSYLAESFGVAFEALEAPSARVAQKHVSIDGRVVTVVLAVPCSFLAASGKTVRRLMRHFSVDTEALVVIYPDLRTTVGRYRVHFGGDASHPGLTDVFEALQTVNFARIGVGTNGVHKAAPADEWEQLIATDFDAYELNTFRRRTLQRVRDGVRLLLSGRYNPRAPFKIDWVDGPHYKCGTCIGEGKFGAVFAAQDTRDGRAVVLKMLKRARDLDRKIALEVEMLVAVRGAPNVVTLLDTAIIEDEEYRDAAMVFEFIDGVPHREFFALMTGETMRIYLFKLLQALAAVHERGVIHLDVKPSNILFNPRTNVFRLLDWGLASFHVDGVPNHGPLGTRCYKAPELCLRYDLYGPPADVWAVGCTLGAMLFQPDGSQPLFRARGSWLNQLIAVVRILGSAPLRAAMERHDMALHLQPDELAALEGFPTVPWRDMIVPQTAALVDDAALDLLDRLLDCDHARRITAAQALQHAFFDSVRMLDCILHPL